MACYIPDGILERARVRQIVDRSPIDSEQNSVYLVVLCIEGFDGIENIAMAKDLEI